MGGRATVVRILLQFGGMQLAFALSGIVDNKILAIRLGPPEFGAFSQLAAGALALGSLVNLGLNVGLARLVAGRPVDDAQRALATAMMLVLLSTCAGWTTILILFEVGSNPIHLLGVKPTPGMIAAAAILAAGLPVDALRTNAQAVLTARGKVGPLSLRWAIADVAGTFIGVPAVIFAGVVGAAFQVTVTGAIVALLLVRRAQVLGFVFFRPLIHRSALRALLAVGGSSLVSGLALAGSDLAVRVHLIAHAGVQANGYLQAALILGTQVKSVILGGIGSYSTVAFKAGSPELEIRTTAGRLASVAAPLALLALGTLGILGGPVTLILFSRQFQPTAGLLPCLLAADFLEVFMWVLIGALLAAGRTRTWLGLNLILGALRLLFGLLLVNVTGAAGVPIAYLSAMGLVVAIHYAIYASAPGRSVNMKSIAHVLAGCTAILVLGYVGQPGELFTPWRATGIACIGVGTIWTIRRSGGVGAIRSVFKPTA